MVKTRKNQKRQRGGGRWFGSNTPQTSCMTDIENYMKNKFNNDVTISNLKTISSNSAACGKSNNIDNNVKSTLYDYMNQINVKLADIKSTCNNNVDAVEKLAAEQSGWQAEQKRINDDIEKRRAQVTPPTNNVVLPKTTTSAELSKELKRQNIEEYRKQNPPRRGGNRKSKRKARKSRKSRKSIKKSKNNKR